MRSDYSFDPKKFFGLEGARHIADSPEEYICKFSGIGAAALYGSIKDAGLSYLLMTPQDCEERQAFARENWIYVYDEKHLQGFLDKNKKVLLAADWPTQAKDFVLYLSYVAAPANSEIFDLIHDCYGADSSKGDNGWLRRNNGTTPKHEIEVQRMNAEMSKQRFKAFRRKDPDAARWFLKTASGGHMGAMEEVSKLYAQGCGFKKDMVEAAFWQRLFARQFEALADGPKEEFTRKAAPDFRLSREQVAEIEKRITAWRPVIPNGHASAAPPRSNWLKRLLHFS